MTLWRVPPCTLHSAIFTRPTTARDVLLLPPDVIAHQFGHKDGGRLIAQNYGHQEGKVARRRIREAHDSAGSLTPLRVVLADGA